jgi:microcompartment protein CcmK/EutM
MKLGVVVGNVVATRKAGNMGGLKLLLVSYLNDELADTKKTAVCVDTVGAGSGEVVLLCSSSSARLTAMTSKAATDNTIVGIVDAVTSGGREVFSKSGTGGT